MFRPRRFAILSLAAVAACEMFPDSPPRSQLDDGVAGDGASAGASGAVGRAGGGTGNVGGSTSQGGGTGGDGGLGGAGQGGSGTGGGGTGADGSYDAGGQGVGGTAGQGGQGGQGVGGTGGAAGAAGAAGAGGQVGPGTTTILLSRSGADDVNEDHKTFEISQDRLWFGTASFKNNSYVSLRFPDSAIPAGAIIESAVLRVYSPMRESAGIALEFRCIAADDCAPFTASDRPSDRARTNPSLDYQATTPWIEGNWNELGNLAAAVQEVVDRPGWQEGRALCIVGKGKGAADVRRYANSFDGGADRAPQLVVTYRLP